MFRKAPPSPQGPQHRNVPLSHCGCTRVGQTPPCLRAAEMRLWTRWAFRARADGRGTGVFAGTSCGNSLAPAPACTPQPIVAPSVAGLPWQRRHTLFFQTTFSWQMPKGVLCLCPGTHTGPGAPQGTAPLPPALGGPVGPGSSHSMLIAQLWGAGRSLRPALAARCLQETLGRCQAEVPVLDAAWVPLGRGLGMSVQLVEPRILYTHREPGQPPSTPGSMSQRWGRCARGAQPGCGFVVALHPAPPRCACCLLAGSPFMRECSKEQGPVSQQEAHCAGSRGCE